jgi:hypothetical protein
MQLSPQYLVILSSVCRLLMSFTFVFPLDRSSTYISLFFTGIDRVSFRLFSRDKIRPRVSRRWPARRDKSRLLVLRHHFVSQEPFRDALNEFLMFRV